MGGGRGGRDARSDKKGARNCVGLMACTETLRRVFFVRKEWERRHDAPGRLVRSRLPPLAPRRAALHRDAGQRGLGAPLRGASPAGKTEGQACADLPTARAYGRTRQRGHRGQSPRPVRLHSASTGCGPIGARRRCQSEEMRAGDLKERSSGSPAAYRRSVLGSCPRPIPRPSVRPFGETSRMLLCRWHVQAKRWCGRSTSKPLSLSWRRGFFSLVGWPNPGTRARAP